jgi:hypothetical protein
MRTIRISLLLKEIGMPERASIGRLLFVRLLRKWSAARASGENPVPHMQAMVLPFDPSPDLALACASLFDLVQAHLGRILVPECCCSNALSRDEEALLGVLRHAPEAGNPIASAAIPHGLPGAIRWAAFAVRRALAASFGTDDLLDVPERAPFARACPFATIRPAVGAMLPPAA